MGLEQGTQVEIFHPTLLLGQRMGEPLLEKLSESETRLLWGSLRERLPDKYPRSLLAEFPVWCLVLRREAIVYHVKERTREKTIVQWTPCTPYPLRVTLVTSRVPTSLPGVIWSESQTYSVSHDFSTQSLRWIAVRKPWPSMGKGLDSIPTIIKNNNKKKLKLKK